MQADHSKTEAASRAAIRGGRPNIRSILKNVQANHPDVSEIHVCAAGKAAACMWLAVCFGRLLSMMCFACAPSQYGRQAWTALRAIKMINACA